MGEAKKRGTYEERKAQAIASKKEAYRLYAEEEKERLAGMTVEERYLELRRANSAQRAMLRISAIYAGLTKEI